MHAGGKPGNQDGTTGGHDHSAWPEARWLGVPLGVEARIPVGEGWGATTGGWPGVAVDADG